MKKVTYRQAGVDIEKADRLIRKIKKSIAATRVAGSMDQVGGFAAFFDPSKYGIKDPLLVSSTDGVGTKLLIAIDNGKHDTVGIDLVAMSVNDCICTGARPVFFLDYYATGKLEGKVWSSVLKGIIKGCKESDCALVGGETAEMPGMYGPKDYDLAGFVVGIVDRKKIIDGKSIKAGDAVIGLASTGFHSNGYSLVRKIFSKAQIKKKSELFLKPTRIYVKPVLDVIRGVKVKGIANITGGGFYDNIPRILPPGCKILIKKNSWTMPEVFRMVTKNADISERELYRTLNMGIGMVLITGAKDAAKAVKILAGHRVKSWVIGRVVRGKNEVELVGE